MNTRVIQYCITTLFTQCRVAVKWWLGLDTSQGSQCAFCPAHSLDPLGHHALTCKCGGDVVLRHNALRDTLVHFVHRAHASVQVEVGAGFFPDHSQSRHADILLQNWNLGRPVALDISVVSPLNPSTLAEAGATFGAVLEATESSKHQANDDKCSFLGWVSTPLAVDSYGAWGKRGFVVFSTSCCSACNPQVPAKVTGFFRPVLQLKHLLN